MIKIILVAIFSLTASAFQVQQVTNVVGAVEKLILDSHKWNCSLYNYEAGDYYRYYKIDAGRNVVLQVNFTMIYDMVINSQDDVYIFASDQVDSISLVKANSTELQTVFKYPSKGYLTGEAFVDNEDNILFNTRDGIVMLKFGDIFPVAIKYLEGYKFRRTSTAVDNDGNIYLAKILEEGNSEIVVITSERKNLQVPYAEVIDELYDPEMKKKVHELGTDVYGNILISVQYFDYNGTVLMIKNGTIDTIISQNDLRHYNFHVAGNRTYFLAGNPDLSAIDFICYLYYIDMNGTLNKIGRTFDADTWLSRREIMSDEYGTLFFVTNYNEVLMLSQNETEVKSLFKSTDSDVLNFYVESSDTVWAITTDDTYWRIPTAPGFGAVGYSGRRITVITAMKKHFVGEIYIGSWDGLFVLNNEF